MLLFVAGPGLVVMLADTDAGSVITAAQSGAQFGYSLLMLQMLLVPILYIVQELTVRLGLATQKGHGELIAQCFGKAWAWLSVGTLMVSCVGALLTEFAGIEGVGRLFGITPWVSISLTILFLVVVVATGSYRRVELIAILIG
ncbi:natural resistance-associated macrophage protein, partial [mine drainage metagenome]